MDAADIRRAVDRIVELTLRPPDQMSKKDKKVQEEVADLGRQLVGQFLVDIHAIAENSK